jgi:hypothetical protein
MSNKYKIDGNLHFNFNNGKGLVINYPSFISLQSPIFAPVLLVPYGGKMNLQYTPEYPGAHLQM